MSSFNVFLFLFDDNFSMLYIENFCNNIGRTSITALNDLVK